MKCRHCETSNRQEAAYCRKCGAPMMKPPNYFGCFRTAVLIYIFLYSFIVIIIGTAMISGLLRSGYNDLQASMVWLGPYYLCQPSSLLVIPVLNKFFYWLISLIVLNILKFDFSEASFSAAMAINISMMLSFLTAGVVQYFILVNAARFVGFLIRKRKTRRV